MTVNLSVCIEMFWTDLPYEARIRRVKAAGYSAIEFWGWRNKDLDAMHAAIEETGLAVAGLISEPAFCLTDYGNEDALVTGVAESAATALSFGCNRMIVTTGNGVANETFEITRRRVVRKLKKMAAVAADKGVVLVLEPLNPLVDHKGYWLTTMAQAADIVQEVDSPGLRILYDLYHQQITEGNLIDNLHQYLSLIGHIHTAGVPGRNELCGGELDYRGLFSAIDEAGYEGYVGLEFRPTKGEESALAEALALLK